MVSNIIPWNKRTNLRTRFFKTDDAPCRHGSTMLMSSNNKSSRALRRFATWIRNYGGMYSLGTSIFRFYSDRTFCIFVFRSFIACHFERSSWVFLPFRFALEKINHSAIVYTDKNFHPGMGTDNPNDPSNHRSFLWMQRGLLRKLVTLGLLPSVCPQGHGPVSFQFVGDRHFPKAFCSVCRSKIVSNRTGKAMVFLLSRSVWPSCSSSRAL